MHLEGLKDKLARHFDFMPEAERRWGGVEFDLAARSNIRNEAYLLFKSAVMYAFDNNEYCFVKEVDIVDQNFVGKLETALLEAAKKYVVPSDEHMSTALTGIIMTPGPVDPALKRYIERYRKQQSYWFGLKGWTSYRIILIETQTQSVTASKEAQKAAKFFVPSVNAEMA
ncbi:hypothetical protein [Acidaminobacter hydrogenoformans]|nr:hypothetical protein [Acidaminobacter hydrogenoformans]